MVLQKKVLLSSHRHYVLGICFTAIRRSDLVIESNRPHITG